MHSLQRVGEARHPLHAGSLGLLGLRHFLGGNFFAFRNVKGAMQSTGMLDLSFNPMGLTTRGEGYPAFDPL